MKHLSDRIRQLAGEVDIRDTTQLMLKRRLPTQSATDCQWCYTNGEAVYTKDGETSIKQIELVAEDILEIVWKHAHETFLEFVERQQEGALVNQEIVTESDDKKE